jgi:hypothetical protein
MQRLTATQQDQVKRVIHALVDDVLDEKNILELIQGFGMPPAETNRIVTAELLGHDFNDGWTDEGYLVACKDHWGDSHERSIKNLRRFLVDAARLDRADPQEQPA